MTSREELLADRLYDYVRKYRDDWPTPGPELEWADLNDIIGALRHRAQLVKAEEIIKRVGEATFIEGTIYEAIRDANRYLTGRLP